MAEQPPVPEVKMTNRRRVAWLSIGCVIGYGIAAMAMPERASQVNAIIISVVGALIGVVIVYMGGAVAMNMKNTGK